MSGADSPRRSASGPEGEGPTSSVPRRALAISALCGAIPVCASLMAAPGTATGSVPPQCASDQLAISLGPYGAGAGHIGVPIRFQNEGRPCRLRGYPGIDGLSADGRVVVRAKRLLHGYLGGARQIATITLGRGQSASAFFEGANFPIYRQPCHSYRDLRITPPDATRGVRLYARYSFCSPRFIPSFQAGQGRADRPATLGQDSSRRRGSGSK